MGVIQRDDNPTRVDVMMVLCLLDDVSDVKMVAGKRIGFKKNYVSNTRKRRSKMQVRKYTGAVEENAPHVA